MLCVYVSRQSPSTLYVSIGTMSNHALSEESVILQHLDMFVVQVYTTPDDYP